METAVKITLSLAQMGPTGLTEIETVGADGGVTVTAIGAEVAVGVVTHVSEEVRITVTTSPLLRVVVEKVLELVPAFAPLTCHWYAGEVPPLVG